MKRFALVGIVAALVSGTVFATPGTLLRDEALRSQALATATVVANAPKGSAVEVLARQGGWLKVKVGNREGWVRLLSVRVGGGGAGSVGLGDVVGAATTKSDPTRVVAVAGLRGLNEENLKQAKFNAAELARLEAQGVTAQEARVFAEKSGLAAVEVPELPKPKPKSAANNTRSSWGDE
jgi:uncharacterized protein YgiM (DUF1202 family)